MTPDEKIRDKKLQYDINKEAAKEKSCGKVDKYELLAGEEILLSSQSRIMKQVTFT